MSRILDNFATVAPFINQITSADIGIVIHDHDTVIKYIPAEKLDLGLKPGDKVKKDSPSDICIRERRRVTKEVGKEIHGVPYIATAFPIIDDNNEVIGTVVTTETTEALDFFKDNSYNLSASSNQLSSSLQELSGYADNLAKTGKKLQESINATIEKVKETDAIVEFINDVASQTNLLGLNAAIEAARVGDVGRGFGVVADEIRKLALHSSNSVKEINQVVESLKTYNKEMYDQSKNVEESTSNQVAIIQEIASSSQELSAMADEMMRFAQNKTDV